MYVTTVILNNFTKLLDKPVLEASFLNGIAIIRSRRSLAVVAGMRNDKLQPGVRKQYRLLPTINERDNVGNHPMYDMITWIKHC